MRFPNRRFKRLQEIFADYALRVISGSSVRACFRLPMHRKMFRRGKDVRLVQIRARALVSVNRRHSKPRNQVRVFAVRLLRPAPSRISGEIQHWRKTFLRSLCANFRRHRREYLLHQRRVPRRRQRDRLRKRSRFRRRVAMQAFLMKQNRNPQSRIFLQPFLDAVGEFRHLARPAVLARAATSRPIHISTAR